MAKRFTDTEKYKKEFFRNLKAPYKLFWDYLYHDCTFAGIWYVEIEVAQARIGKDAPIEKQRALKIFNDGELRVAEIDSGKKWLIIPFIHFQYGDLVETNKMHKGVLKELAKNGVDYPFDLKGYARGIYTPWEKSKGAKVKDKEKEKEKVINNIIQSPLKNTKENNIINDIKIIIDDLNIVLGTSYKSTSDKNASLIKARLNEGFSVDDFKLVHRKMFNIWGSDQKMCKYLRPITLYSPKFESYLNAIEPSTKVSEKTLKSMQAAENWLARKEKEENAR